MSSVNFTDYRFNHKCNTSPHAHTVCMQEQRVDCLIDPAQGMAHGAARSSGRQIRRACAAISIIHNPCRSRAVATPTPAPLVGAGDAPR